MASWTWPWHFQVHAACRTGTKLRTVVQQDDEQKWEWIPRKEAAQSVGSSVADGATTPINDPNYDDFSVLEASVSYVYHGESKDSMHRETVARQREKVL